MTSQNEHSESELLRIKAKIAKLMALAERGGTEHEAANAMAKARALMDKYQLEQADIIDIGGEKQEFLSAAATRAFNSMPEYLNWLAVGVARFNDCQAVTTWGHEINFKKNDKRQNHFGKRIEFRGLKQDVEMAIDMYARLQGAVNRLCKEWLVENGHEGRYPVGLGTQFKAGACTRLYERLKALTKERESLTVKSTGNALVVVKGAAVAKYFGEVSYEKSNWKGRPDAKSIDAFREGRKGAETVEIQKKVS